jgi:hypothetical protein
MRKTTQLAVLVDATQRAIAKERRSSTFSKGASLPRRPALVGELERLRDRLVRTAVARRDGDALAKADPAVVRRFVTTERVQQETGSAIALAQIRAGRRS